PDVDDGIELILERDLPHITVDPLDLNTLSFCVCSGLLEENFAEVLSGHPITALGERNGVAPVTAAEVKNAAPRRQGKALSDLLHLVLGPFRRTAEVVQIIFSKELTIPRRLIHHCAAFARTRLCVSPSATVSARVGCCPLRGIRRR